MSAVADTTIKGCPQLMQVRLLATARSPLVKGAEYGVSRHLFCIEPDTFQIRSPRRLKAAPGVDTEPGPRRGTIPNRYLNLASGRARQIDAFVIEAGHL